MPDPPALSPGNEPVNSRFPGLAITGRASYDLRQKEIVNNPSPSPSKDHVEAVFSGSLTVIEALPVAVNPGAGEVPDAELVTRCQNGSTEAFETLVTRYRGRIYAMTLNMTGNDADAWDLSQEVFIKAWRSLPKFEARSQFFTWIYRITHNVVIDWVRKRKIQGGTEFNDELGTVPAAGAVTTPHGTLEPDRAMAQRLHAVIKTSAPVLSPKTWYGMPAYAKNGKVVCFFQSAQKFKSRYATFGFSDQANLDEGVMWPTSYALTKLTAAEEANISALVKKAVS